MQSHLTYAHTPAHPDHWLLCPRGKGPLHQGCLAEEGRGPLAGSTWEAGPGAGRARCPVHPHGGHRDADAPRGAPRGLPSCVTCPRLSQDPRLLWLWGPGQRGRSAEAHGPPGACMRRVPRGSHRRPPCTADLEWPSRPPRPSAKPVASGGPGQAPGSALGGRTSGALIPRGLQAGSVRIRGLGDPPWSHLTPLSSAARGHVACPRRLLLPQLTRTGRRHTALPWVPSGHRVAGL